ncbi:MAG: glycogen-binding domain-containing protein [Planctomycetes bacterium]|nr:glycogen-binding domain-containing protein [Planctomycetota bacterium]
MAKADKEAKEALLRELLLKDKDLSMKEANVIIRENFDTGIAPPAYAKVKKSLSEDENSDEQGAKEPETKKSDKPKAEKAKAPKKAKKKKTSPDSEDEKAPSIDEFFASAPEKGRKKEQPVETNQAGSLLLGEKDNLDDEAQKNKERALKVKKAFGSSLDEATEPESAQKKEVEPEPEPEPPPVMLPVNVKVKIAKASEVHIAGSFNKWKKDEYEMKKVGIREWVFDKELPEGKHNFKFVVDQNKWHIDFDRDRVIDETGVSHTIEVV